MLLVSLAHAKVLLGYTGHFLRVDVSVISSVIHIVITQHRR